MSERTERLFALLAPASRAGTLAITGHDMPDVDAVASCLLMRAMLRAAGLDARIALPTEPDAQARRVLARFGEDVCTLRGELRAQDELVLVDHHQPLHPGHVLACVDHHPTDFLPDFPYVQIEPAGACAVMVLRLMEEAGLRLTEAQTRLAVTALYLDTMALRSAKMPPEDIPWAREAVARFHMDEAWLLREGLGLADLTRPVGELAMGGLKRYDFGGRTVCSSYVQTDAMTSALCDRLLERLREERIRAGADMWVFLVHDPVAMRSVEYDLTAAGTREIRYEYLASRGKHVMPRVEREMREQWGGKNGGKLAP